MIKTSKALIFAVIVSIAALSIGQIAAVQIENRGQIELFSEQAKLRHIGDPLLVRLFGAEVPV